MRVYKFENNKGNINALILVEPADMQQNPAEISDDDLQLVISGAIMSLAESKGMKFMFPKILSYDEQDDGAIMINFEAAAAPQVSLGRYKGIKVPAHYKGEDFNEKAVQLAAENIDAEVPAIIVEHELESLKKEKKSEVLDDLRLNIITDIHKILEQAIHEVTPDYKKDQVWLQAIETSDAYYGNGGRPSMSIDTMVSAVADVLSQYGPITDDLCATIANIIDKRMKERDKLTAESLADQVFETYLKIKGFDEAQWEEQNHQAALERTRKNLLLDAIAEAEKLEVGDSEVLAEVDAIAREYEITADQVRQIVSEEAIRYQLRQDKAEKIIIDNAEVLA